MLTPFYRLGTLMPQGGERGGAVPSHRFLAPALALELGEVPVLQVHEHVRRPQGEQVLAGEGLVDLVEQVADARHRRGSRQRDLVLGSWSMVQVACRVAQPVSMR